MKKRAPDDDEGGLGENPLDDPLLETLYGVPARAPSTATKAPRGRGHRRPLKEGRTYRLVTFSVYEDDVALLDALLAEAKAMGIRGASRSLIVRLALRQVDLEALRSRL